jgi:hypothetical protein
MVCVRQSSIHGRDADLQAPKDSSVERPSYDLDLGAPNPIVMLSRVEIEVCTLLRRHVAVGEPIEFRTN